MCNISHITSFSSFNVILYFDVKRTQLLKINVPATFMLVALDEGPGPPIRYQYAELGKLYQVVSQLIRCCDTSSKMQSSVQVSLFVLLSVKRGFIFSTYLFDLSIFLC